MKSTNKIRIATIICWCVVVLALAGIAIWLLTGSLFGIPTGFKLPGLAFGGIETHMGQYSQAGAHTETADGIDSLVIDWVAGKVTVTPHDGNDIEFAEYAQRDLKENERMYITVSGGKITVKFIETSRLKSMPPKRLEVLVPRELCDTLKLLDTDTTSADINISGIAAATMKTGSTSGDVELTDVQADTMSSSTTSGNITLTNAACGKLSLGSTSGDMYVSGSSANTLSSSSTSGKQRFYGAFIDANLDCTSGDITIESSASGGVINSDTTSGNQTVSGAFGKLNLNAVSGDVRVTNSAVPAALDIGTTSGNVTLTLPDDGSISLHHSSVSGSLNSDLPVTLKSKGGSLKISTVSGNVKILQLQ